MKPDNVAEISHPYLKQLEEEFRLRCEGTSILEKIKVHLDGSNAAELKASNSLLIDLLNTLLNEEAVPEKKVS